MSFAVDASYDKGEVNVLTLFLDAEPVILNGEGNLGGLSLEPDAPDANDVRGMLTFSFDADAIVVKGERNLGVFSLGLIFVVAVVSSKDGGPSLSTFRNS